MRNFNPDTDCSVWIARLNASRTITNPEFYVKTALQMAATLPAVSLFVHQWWNSKSTKPGYFHYYFTLLILCNIIDYFESDDQGNQLDINTKFGFTMLFVQHAK